MSPIKVLYPADSVRQHPEMYWAGNPSPGVVEVNAAIADQLKTDGCRKIEIRSNLGWQLVSCELDWVKIVSAQFGSIRRLFEDAVTIPGPTAGGLRPEWLVAVLAAAVCVWVDGQLEYSKGPVEPTWIDFMPWKLQDRVCIAYRLASSKEPNED